MNNQIKFTLDNLTYACIVNNNDDISFVLPHKIPNTTFSDKGSNIIKAADITKIEVYVRVNSDTAPNVEVISEDEDVKTTIVGSLKFEPDTVNLVSFITIDGGNNWLVNSTSTSVTDEEKEDALAVANEAKTLAETANTTAGEAKTLAETANSTATTAKSTADSNTSEISTISGKVTTLEGKVSSLEERVTALESPST